MKTKYPRKLALEVTRAILEEIGEACERVIVAGSLRRRKPEVGDIEIVYIPITEMRPVPGDMFREAKADLVNLAIKDMMARGIMELRRGESGHTAYGERNKLMTHIPTGMPVDFFATVETSWWNYLVCRTGPKESNMRIAEAARAKGWRWNPYGSGFSGPGNEFHQVTSEADVFDFVGLPYREPCDR